MAALPIWLTKFCTVQDAFVTLGVTLELLATPATLVASCALAPVLAETSFLISPWYP